MSDKPLVIQSEELNSEPAAWLGERCELVPCPGDDRDRLYKILPDADGMVIRTYTRIDRSLLDHAPHLKVVGRAGVGLDNVDLPLCAQRGVTVVHTPDANTSAVSEYVFALLFDALRPRVFLSTPLSKNDWCKARRELTAPRQLCEMTLGIYGMGRIGQRLARAAQGLGIRTLYHDLLEIPAERRSGALPVSRDELLSTADIITIHVDGRPENTNLINAEAVRLMKPDAVFVNTSRGFIVDPFAIAEFMLAHPAACAMLDVHEPEPITAANPLLDIKNVHLSPHLAACTEAAHRNMSWVVKDVWRVLSGQQPEFPAKA